jgi:predicted RND superfamily exporter protein/glycosyltransferase involved in cell wall biosynthesis
MNKWFENFITFICRHSYRRPMLFIFLAAIITIPAVWQLNELGLDQDLIRLLPDENRSVILKKKMDKIVSGSGGFFAILLESPYEGRLLEAFHAAVKGIGKIEGVGFLQYENPREFYQKYRYLLIPSADLDKISEFLIRLEAKTSPIGVDLLEEEQPVEENDEDKKRVKNLKKYLDLTPYHQSEDGRVMGIKVYPRHGETGLERSRKLLLDLQVFTRRISEEFSVWGGVSGSLRDHLVQYDFILSDLTRSGLITLALILAALFVGFRDFRTLPVVLLPLVLGLIWTLGSIPFFVGELNVISSFLLLVSFGLGIDFSIHLVKRFQVELQRKQPYDALLASFSSTGKSVFLSGATTAAALFVLSFSHFRGFSEFGLVGGFSIIVILAAMIVFLPSIVVLGWKFRLLRIRTERPRSLKTPQPFLTVLLLTAVMGAFALGISGLEFDYDFSRMEAEVSQEKDLKDRYYKVYESKRSPGALFVARGTQSLDGLIASLDERIAEDSQSRIQRFQSIRDLSPEEEEVGRRMSSLAEIKEMVKGRWIQRVKDADYKEFIDDMRQWTPPSKPPAFSDIPEAITDGLVSKSYPDHYIAHVYIKGEKQKGKNAIAFSRELYDLSKSENIIGPYGGTTVLSEVLQIVTEEGLILVIAAFACIFLIIFLQQRSFSQVLWIVSPLITGLTLTFGIMVILGLKLNFFNVVVFPTLIGIGVDDGVHYYRRWRENRKDTDRTQRELFGILSLTTATTMFSYFGIALSRHPGLQSIGLLACIGLVCTWLSSVFLLPGILDFVYSRSRHRNPQHQKVLPKASFSVVLCFYNETPFLEETLHCWLRQTRQPDQLILVDNGSTDGSMAVARSMLKNVSEIEVLYLNEPQPGKVHALKTGCEAVNCDCVVLSDADVYYPSHYLELCERLFSEYDTKLSALMAVDIYGDPDSILSRLKRRSYTVFQKIWPKLSFTGGFGQIFRTDALFEAGGFSESRWPFILMDHEIMYRIFKNGFSLYHKDLWCRPSYRRKKRDRVRWNLFERFLYYLVPYSLHGWFFYGFLASRFKKRDLNHLRLREKPWAE